MPKVTYKSANLSVTEEAQPVTLEQLEVRASLSGPGTSDSVSLIPNTVRSLL